MRRQVRACLRLARMLAHIATGLGTVLLRFRGLSVEEQHARVQAWARQMLRHAGVELQVRGTPPAHGPVLLVANHISWLDIPVMHAARHCRFISKSDVKAWPVLGRLATAAGTLYIERASRRDALRVVQTMRESLERGEILGVFPEGTTSNGIALLPFHANLLQAAISADAPVQPVGLRFIDPRTGAPSQAASYVGDETLVGSLWRTLCADGLVAVVHYGLPQRADGRDRRTWADDLRGVVDGLRRG
ncbi:1-acyl-sn-glycerol-3-phosphate acyltransferase [Acidovorax sp. Leaf160]|uniref:lysophospholipid acyltransferase family protein n=1 Tax=Acidovorax sp. Leaf160 TaxID=1736280 RepID=UPI0006F2E287|nr:lysophospholipid acyltransferase family protein [Acidovorax sp. Leaf160]KQR63194.1 glycerol acyltransferase [Acidovorax sp. Leaf160]